DEWRDMQKVDRQVVELEAGGRHAALLDRYDYLAANCIAINAVRR
ncbi:unnamed protein product, partial [marine sediment metagenome]